MFYFSGPFHPQQLSWQPRPFVRFGAPANQWFALYEDAGPVWRWAGWIWSEYATVQFLAMHLVQCRVGLGMAELRYLITDERGDGVVDMMRPPHV